MTDRIETIGFGTVIQHGKLNDRIYLMKLDKKDFPDILNQLYLLAEENSYTKLFCKIPAWAVPVFISNGFIIEAQIPNFYNTQVDVFFVSNFLDHNRFLNSEHKQMKELTQMFLSMSLPKNVLEIPSVYDFSALNELDADEISALYKIVFESYPFPIFDPAYMRFTMKENVQYFGVRFKGELIALSSAEIDMKGQNVEMTDFATLPAYRGNNLSSILLKKMEIEMKKQGITTLYTIARLNSPAMNKTFLNLNYKYAGTLINNTNISGKIESMNVYYKHLEKNQ